MKARSREINIFNMSLLDILCGALGAFCFMMLVLFPYYSQDKGKSQRPDIQQGIDPKTFDQARARIQQLEETLEKFKRYADQLEAQNKRLEAQQRQQQGDLKQMENRALQAEMRNPILTVSSFTGIQQDELVEMYIDSNRTYTDNKPGPKLDPIRHQDPAFQGDIYASGPGSVLSYFMVRDTPRNSDYTVYAKIIKLDPGHSVNGVIVVSANDTFKVARVHADKDKTAIPIAAIKMYENHKVTKCDMVIPPQNILK